MEDLYTKPEARALLQGVKVAPGVRARAVEAVQKDGTVVVEVRLSFVVSHAASEPVTEANLSELIERRLQPDCGAPADTLAEAIDGFKVIAAHND